MSGFQWWLLIVGLVVGGAVVAVLTMNAARGDADLAADEREAEATFIAAHLADRGVGIDRATVARVLEAHREYLALPAPDAIVPAESIPGDGWVLGEASSPAGRHPDGEPDDVGDRGGSGTDRDLPGA